jgi:hypothetical protein
LRIQAHDGAQDVALNARVPLTDEHWVHLPQGAVLVAQAEWRRGPTGTP